MMFVKKFLNPKLLCLTLKFNTFYSHWYFPHTVKPVLSGHLQIDKTKVLMENGSLMKVKGIAECPPPYPLKHSAILLTCIKR